VKAIGNSPIGDQTHSDALAKDSSTTVSGYTDWQKHALLVTNGQAIALHSHANMEL
jgi:hypothetical protein